MPRGPYKNVGGRHVSEATTPVRDSSRASLIGPRVNCSRRTPQPCFLILTSCSAKINPLRDARALYGLQWPACARSAPIWRAAGSPLRASRQELASGGKLRLGGGVDRFKSVRSAAARC